MGSIKKRILGDNSVRYDSRTRIDGRVVTKTFARKHDAEAWLTAIEADKLRGVVVDPAGGRITVKRLSDLWLAANPAKRETTLARDMAALDVDILPAIGSRQIQTIHPPDVQQLVNLWATKHAASTVARTFGTLRAVMNYAVDSEYIGRSPCRRVKLPRGSVRKAQVLSGPQVAVLADAMDARYSLMVWVGALTGLRWGEVAGLHVGSLDLLARTLTVDQIVTRDRRGRSILGPPKSDAGKRTIALPEVLVEPLAAHLASMRLSAADPVALLFPGAEGGLLSYTNFRTRVWKPATISTGLAGVGFHDLRRTNATMLISSGVDVRTAQGRLGHADPRTTLGLYAQFVSAADRDAAAALGRFGAPNQTLPRDRRAMSAGRPKRLEG